MCAGRLSVDTLQRKYRDLASIIEVRNNMKDVSKSLQRWCMDLVVVCGSLYLRFVVCNLSRVSSSSACGIEHRDW